jgi:hypothetical protein
MTNDLACGFNDGAARHDLHLSFVIERSEVIGRQAFIDAAPSCTALTMFW